ncbi:hypothetical protein [Sinorhizobium terangae]|uniref:hypothetical protein n=1 Tax=Sinorhizobium terangae TaxID=110322 RepID=UPI0024B23785|nr:hypothetical protein [Sinorhizobium terangae]WFU50710.1 hypothetical protein QA637_18885 [Sinorhizobium terangae]
MTALRTLTTLALTVGIVALCAEQRAVAQSLKDIEQIAGGSGCATREWKRRGLAPKPYIKGMAMVFARAICQPGAAGVVVVSATPEATSSKADALTHYGDIFAAKNMINSTSGEDTLRHAYVLLIGLGMMESAGKYCEGRDVSQCFAEASSAEAGLFQTSWGVNKASFELKQLFDTYSSKKRDCMLPIFKGNLTCKIRKSHNPKCPDSTSDVAGSGVGADWQKLTKACPAFAVEYAAIVLRTSGGAKGEFNPIRKKQAEVSLQCDSMLQRVQRYVKENPSVCSKFR